MSPAATLALVTVKPNPWEDWGYVVGPFLFYLAVVWLLVFTGRSEEGNPVVVMFKRISDSLHRSTGYPGWTMAGVLSGLLVLLVAAMGLYWDVAWHVDLGRDKMLLNPSHVMILLGLGGLFWAAFIASVFATIDKAPVGFKFKGVTVPWTALAMAALGAGGIAAFPIDDLWHRAYGLDVTLWSPSHLQLLGGGALATIPVWMMIAEGSKGAKPTKLGRFIHIMAAGACLVGLTTFQGEFDYGVPQFQLVYLPILMMAASSIGLVWARLALGRWGAIKTMAFYWGVRLYLILIVAVALNHTVPRFPLYLGAALCVELAAWLLGTQNRMRFALGAGALNGTLGLMAEGVFIEASGWAQISPALVPKSMVLGFIASIAGAIIGARLARSFTYEEEGARLPGAATVAAGVALVAVLLYPLPRNVGDVDVAIRSQQVGDHANVSVELFPPDAAENAAAFNITSWQGGGRFHTELRKVGEGRYESVRPVPVTGTWKSMVNLYRGDEVMAAPIYLPEDRLINAPAIPLLPERRTEFVKNTDILLREVHAGPQWPSIVAFSALGLILIGWISLIRLADRHISEDHKGGGGVSQRPRLAVGFSSMLPKS
ncbi:MAG: hypothetical protein M3164_06590 [Actinomycetota bacterium]|nr:hypothetical protein [Actinomycetota bacterium]